MKQHNNLEDSQIHNAKGFEPARKRSLSAKNSSSVVDWVKATYTSSVAVTCGADVGGSVHHRYFCLYNSYDATKYAVYFQTTNTDVMATPTGYGGVIAANAASSGHGSTAAEIGTALRLVLNAHADFSATDNGAGIVTITGLTNASPSVDGDTTFSISVTDTEVVNEVLTTDASGNMKWVSKSTFSTEIEDVEGTSVKSTGEEGGTKFLREDGDGSCSWQEGGTTQEGVDIKSTGEAGSYKFLRTDGDDSCSWQTPPGSGATNLNTTQTATTVDVTSDSGNDATLPQAIAGGNAGVMSGVDKTKLDGIDTSADVTDATNVTAAGALMESTLDSVAAVRSTTGIFLTADETKLDNLVTNATHTGDATGDAALTLATVNTNVGSFTNADVTVNGKGLITAVSNGSGGGEHIPEGTSVKSSGEAVTKFLRADGDGTCSWQIPVGGGVGDITEVSYRGDVGAKSYHSGVADFTIAGGTGIRTTIVTDTLTITLDETPKSKDDIDDLTGVTGTDLGTFTGATISDSRDIKDALQDLETDHEVVKGTSYHHTSLRYSANNLDGTSDVSGGNDAWGLQEANNNKDNMFAVHVDTDDMSYQSGHKSCIEVAITGVTTKLVGGTIICSGESGNTHKVTMWKGDLDGGSGTGMGMTLMGTFSISGSANDAPEVVNISLGNVADCTLADGDGVIILLEDIETYNDMDVRGTITLRFKDTF